MHCTKENISRKLFVTRYPHIKLERLFTAWGLAHRFETASELTGESRTKVAQAKSKGLVRTLILEALTAQKTWEEIKDSLQLKILNVDIHTSISCFTDIQQTDKESLAAYLHRFKQEANRCKFNNDTATIRIFLKSLKNAHTLATKVRQKSTAKPSRHHKGSWKTSGCTTNNIHLNTYFIGQYHVQWQWQVFPMSGNWPHGMLLSPYKMFWL